MKVLLIIAMFINILLFFLLVPPLEPASAMPMFTMAKKKQQHLKENPSMPKLTKPQQIGETREDDRIMIDQKAKSLDKLMSQSETITKIRSQRPSGLQTKPIGQEDIPSGSILTKRDAVVSHMDQTKNHKPRRLHQILLNYMPITLQTPTKHDNVVSQMDEVKKHEPKTLHEIMVNYMPGTSGKTMSSGRKDVMEDKPKSRNEMSRWRQILENKRHILERKLLSEQRPILTKIETLLHTKPKTQEETVEIHKEKAQHQTEEILSQQTAKDTSPPKLRRNIRSVEESTQQGNTRANFTIRYNHLDEDPDGYNYEMDYEDEPAPPATPAPSDRSVNRSQDVVSNIMNLITNADVITRKKIDSSIRTVNEGIDATPIITHAEDSGLSMNATNTNDPNQDVDRDDTLHNSTVNTKTSVISNILEQEKGKNSLVIKSTIHINMNQSVSNSVTTNKTMTEVSSNEDISIEDDDGLVEYVENSNNQNSTNVSHSLDTELTVDKVKEINDVDEPLTHFRFMEPLNRKHLKNRKKPKKPTEIKNPESNEIKITTLVTLPNSKKPNTKTSKKKLIEYRKHLASYLKSKLNPNRKKERKKVWYESENPIIKRILKLMKLVSDGKKQGHVKRKKEATLSPTNSFAYPVIIRKHSRTKLRKRLALVLREKLKSIELRRKHHHKIRNYHLRKLVKKEEKETEEQPQIKLVQTLTLPQKLTGHKNRKKLAERVYIAKAMKKKLKSLKKRERQRKTMNDLLKKMKSLHSRIIGENVPLAQTNRTTNEYPIKQPVRKSKNRELRERLATILESRLKLSEDKKQHKGGMNNQTVKSEKTLTRERLANILRKKLPPEKAEERKVKKVDHVDEFVNFLVALLLEGEEKSGREAQIRIENGSAIISVRGVRLNIGDHKYKQTREKIIKRIRLPIIDGYKLDETNVTAVIQYLKKLLEMNLEKLDNAPEPETQVQVVTQKIVQTVEVPTENVENSQEDETSVSDLRHRLSKLLKNRLYPVGILSFPTAEDETEAEAPAEEELESTQAVKNEIKNIQQVENKIQSIQQVENEIKTIQQEENEIKNIQEVQNEIKIVSQVEDKTKSVQQTPPEALSNTDAENYSENIKETEESDAFTVTSIRNRLAALLTRQLKIPHERKSHRRRPKPPIDDDYFET